MKVHILYVIMCKFKNSKNTTGTAKQISSVYDQGAITNCQVRNWFTKFKNIISGDEKWVFYDNVQCKKKWIEKGESSQNTQKVELY